MEPIEPRRAALHSGDPAFNAPPAYFESRLEPAFQKLLTSAEEAHVVRAGVDPMDLLGAVASLCIADDGARAHRMVALLIDGLRFGART